MLKPRIFISSVTGEFGSLRQLIAPILDRLGYDPVWQDIFGTEPGDLRDVLREKIDGCDGLIQIVGRAYGAEPPTVDPQYGRVSYTQFEFLYAEQLQSTRPDFKTWLILPGEACTRDTPLGQLDLPRDPAESDPLAWQQARRDLQQAYIARLKLTPHLRHEPSDTKDFIIAIERLRDDFPQLRRRYIRWQRRVATALAVLVLLVVGVWSFQWWSHREIVEEQQQQTQNIDRQTVQLANVKERQVAIERTQEEIKARQAVTKGKILAHLTDAIDRVRREALATADQLKTSAERERARDEAERVH